MEMDGLVRNVLSKAEDKPSSKNVMWGSPRMLLVELLFLINVDLPQRLLMLCMGNNNEGKERLKQVERTE